MLGRIIAPPLFHPPSLPDNLRVHSTYCKSGGWWWMNNLAAHTHLLDRTGGNETIKGQLTSVWVCSERWSWGDTPCDQDCLSFCFLFSSFLSPLFFRGRDALYIIRSTEYISTYRKIKKRKQDSQLAGPVLSPYRRMKGGAVWPSN